MVSLVKFVRKLIVFEQMKSTTVVLPVMIFTSYFLDIYFLCTKDFFLSLCNPLCRLICCDIEKSRARFLLVNTNWKAGSLRKSQFSLVHFLIHSVISQVVYLVLNIHGHKYLTLMVMVMVFFIEIVI